MSTETTATTRGGAVEEKLRGYHVWVMLIAVLGYASVAADSALLPMALPLLTEDLALDLSKLGYIYAAGFLACGIVSIAIGGRAIDKWGRKPVLAVALITTATFTMVSTLAWDAGSFTVARTIAAVGYMTWGTAAVLIAETVPPKHRGWMVACVPAGWGAGFAVSAMFTGQVATSIGWRPTFLMIGALPLVLALLVIFTIKETPRFLAIKRVGKDEGAALNEAKPSLGALFRPELRRRTIGVGLFFFFAVWVLALTPYYTMPYLDSRGIDFLSASNAATIGNWIGVGAAVAAGVFSIARGSHGALIILSVLNGVAAVILVMVGESLIIPMFIVCLVGSLALWGAIPNFAQEAFPTWVRGTGGSFAAGVAWCAWGVCALLVEPFVTAFSWNALTLMIAIPFTLICVIGLLITPRPARKNAALHDF